MKKKSSLTPLTAKSYLNKSNLFGMAISILFGMVGYLFSYLLPVGNEKVAFAMCISTCYVLYCIVVEIKALKSLGRKTQIHLRGNELLGSVFVQSTVLLGGAWLLYARLPLSSMMDFLTFSLLTYFFVSGLFETHRLLRR